MPVNGLNNALIPIVSFNYGARQRSRITGVIHFALVLSAAIMAVGTVVFLAIPGPLRLFDADAAVLAEWHLRPASLPSPSYAWCSRILCAALQALGGGQFQPGGFRCASLCPFPAGPAAGRAPALSGVAGLPPVRGGRLSHRPAALPPHRTGPAGGMEE
ncbi:MAG: MATE family efflux transporter [Flavonifractor plautii]